MEGDKNNLENTAADAIAACNDPVQSAVPGGMSSSGNAPLNAPPKPSGNTRRRARPSFYVKTPFRRRQVAATHRY